MQMDEDFGVCMMNTFITFHMDGSAISFGSCIPTLEEIESLQHVTITSTEPWDPKTKPLNISNVRHASLLHHKSPLSK